MYILSSFWWTRLTSVDDTLVRERIGVNGNPPNHWRIQWATRNTLLGTTLHGQPFHLIQDVPTLQHPPEDGVHIIQVRLLLVGDEEL